MGSIPIGNNFLPNFFALPRVNLFGNVANFVYLGKIRMDSVVLPSTSFCTNLLLFFSEWSFSQTHEIGNNGIKGFTT